MAEAPARSWATQTRAEASVWPHVTTREGISRAFGIGFLRHWETTMQNTYFVT